MSEALKLMSQSDGMSASIEKQIVSELDCASTQLHKERAHQAMQSAKLSEKHTNELHKERAHHLMQSAKLCEKHTNDTQSHALTINKTNAKVSVINNECAVSLLE
jgi:PBP1b-binding outer membrane lipoprotein LpoB